jgi:hypothetical protein
MNKLSEIAISWISAANPTEEQQLIAEKRIAICETCEYSRYSSTLNLHYCGDCGCPLNKKIYSPMPNEEACEKGFWKNIK